MSSSAVIVAIVVSLGWQFVSPLPPDTWLPEKPTKHYVSPKECGFEFNYPEDWVVTPADEKCQVRLRPADFVEQMKEYDVDVYTLVVGSEDVGFLAAASRNFFDFQDGKWVLFGGNADVEADVVRTERWSGLRGWRAARCYHERGGYAGACDVPALLLRDGKYNVWSMEGGPKSKPTFDAIFASFRFVATP